MIEERNLIETDWDNQGVVETDFATDAYILADRMPRHRWHMDGIKELRSAYQREEPDARNNLLPGAKHVASVPWYVMTALSAQYGTELFADDGKLFYKWLDKHPEYKIAR